MAIKPQTLAELKHGKFICRAVYPTFVATWNWIVRFTSTIKGDFDVNPKTGVVTVDRTDPDHPVIRLRQDKLLKGDRPPDNISTEFIPDPPSGTSPDGDEGKLQIKGFKAGAPADQNTVTDYLQGVADIPTGGISLVCRTIDTNQARQIIYLPLSALFSSSSISGNVSLSYLADIQWDTSTHTLQKKVNTVNLKTGAVTQGNWQTITNGNTTPISSIIN